MTTDARARLLEVMARASFENNMPGQKWDPENCSDCAVFIADTEAAIAAAEREGFRFLGPDDGR